MFKVKMTLLFLVSVLFIRITKQLIAIRNYFYAILEVILGCKNPWKILLILLGLKDKTVIEVKTKPERLSILVNKRNYKILYYICLLRNKQHLIFWKETLAFPPHRVALKQNELSEKKLAIILKASNYGLLLDEYDKEHWIVNLKNGLKFKVRKDISADVHTVVDIFCKGVYNKFCSNIEGKVVLDIGAFIGDTPIMFSINGAKLVVAYEPDPSSYKLALENIRLNNIKNVKLVSAGICDKRGTMMIKGYIHKEEITVNMLSLNEVIESMEEVDLIKMDCEGCEFPAVMSTSNETLSRVKELIIEYRDYPGLIVKKLESTGFTVKVEKPCWVSDGKPIGFLYAKRNEKINCKQI